MPVDPPWRVWRGSISCQQRRSNPKMIFPFLVRLPRPQTRLPRCLEVSARPPLAITPPRACVRVSSAGPALVAVHVQCQHSLVSRNSGTVPALSFTFLPRRGAALAFPAPTPVRAGGNSRCSWHPPDPPANGPCRHAAPQIGVPAISSKGRGRDGDRSVGKICFLFMLAGCRALESHSMLSPTICAHHPR